LSVVAVAVKLVAVVRVVCFTQQRNPIQLLKQ
jgi:hypothetical protein